MFASGMALPAGEPLRLFASGKRGENLPLANSCSRSPTVRRPHSIGDLAARFRFKPPPADALSLSSSSSPRLCPLSVVGLRASTSAASHARLSPPSHLQPPARRPALTRLSPPPRLPLAANAGDSGAVAPATAGRRIHRPPLPSRLPLASLSPRAGRYRPGYRPH